MMAAERMMPRLLLLVALPISVLGQSPTLSPPALVSPAIASLERPALLLPNVLPPAEDLPNDPGWTLPPPPPPLPPCPAATPQHQAAVASATAASPVAAAFVRPCIQVNPYKRFLDTTTPIPLSPRQKAYLAFHNFRDPANILTIFGTAAFTVGANAHTAYGPGWNGFLRNSAYSFSQDATGEFLGTFLIPSLTREDPHYRRIPHATFPRRILHALARTAVAQHDNGSPMPNYAVLLTYPLSAGISNLYVPGVHGNLPSTVKRVVTGLATDPVNNLITEFLPDLAKRVNIQVVFVQRVLNAVAADGSIER